MEWAAVLAFLQEHPETVQGLTQIPLLGDLIKIAFPAKPSQSTSQASVDAELRRIAVALEEIVKKLK